MAQDPYRYFRVEARELIDRLGKGVLDLEKGASAGVVSQLLRLAHTLKGAARVVRQSAIAEQAHAIEGVLEPYRASPERITSGRINELLMRLDAIAGVLAAISTADQSNPGEPGRSAERGRTAEPEQSADEASRAVLAEIDEIDELLDGVAETFTHLNALRETIGSVERARHVAELLSAQTTSRLGRTAAPAISARNDRSLPLAEELRGAISNLERGLSFACDRMGRELRQVRETAERLRLVPAATLFTSLKRAVRDTAQALGKSAHFVGHGGDARLDGHVLRSLQGALLQVARNAVAHGIEGAGERAAAGKPELGTVAVTIEQRGRYVLFRCEDDGRGIDAEAVRSAALRRGIAPGEVERLDSAGIAPLLLRGGVSTSASVTEVAGRGIGMDIVREAVERLGGQVSIHTEPGRGTQLEMRVPASLAAINALVVESDGALAVIPLDAVLHTQRVQPNEISQSANGESIVIDDKVVPFVPLARMLRGSANARVGREVSAVVVKGRGSAAAFGVDRLLGTSNIVLRPLPDLAPVDRIVAGASLDAEGNPQLVLDAEGLVAAAHLAAGDPLEETSRALPVLVVDDSLTTRMLQQSILESAGYEVDLASSGEEGLERARRKKFALMLVDVEMPGMDGFAFIKRIREDPALSAIPAILVTSLASPEHIRRGEEVGAQGYMIKSEFDQAQLLSMIRRLTV